MSEGANSVPQICENSLTTLKEEVDPEELPPRTISHTTRRPRFGTGNVPLSPYILIDGRKLRSSLALSKKKVSRRVSFPTNDNHLITGYLEPANPWKLAENVNHEDLITAYKESCTKHNSDPLDTVICQLKNADTSELRIEELNLKGEMLSVDRAEPLEEVFKRIQFNKIDLECTSLDDESSVILFDMLEYYESVKHLNISSNQGIGIHGWQACANMIRKTQCLEHLEAKDVILNEQYMNILSRALRLVCHLHVLKLENCGLSGRSIVTLVAALKMNTGIRELYLADNGLNFYDAIQLGSLLRLNNHIQLLDISNNIIQDDGVRDILEGLINQINEDKDGKGLSILILWNNQLTKKSSPYFARIIALSKTLETLNIGKNTLTDELLFIIKDALKKNRVLLQLGIQSTDITCDGIVTLSEIIEINHVLQRIDLRNNSIWLTGMEALRTAMKKNKSITKIDLDDKPDVKMDHLTQILPQYTQLAAEIRSSCLENERNRSLEETSEGYENSYRSRLYSTTSRKISLTCQTLPCSLPSTISVQKEDGERSMLEPKRINGGRLRSPAPSPASSPVASPILSPSRSRFVVSRVPETLRSTETPVSSSSVVLSPLGSSPACVASASAPSRFRVSVVESANAASVSQPVTATTDADIPVVSKPKVRIIESTDSDDSDNVFASDLEMNNDKAHESSQSTSNDVSRLVSNMIDDACIAALPDCPNLKELNANAPTVTSNDKISSVAFQHENDANVRDNRITSTIRSVEVSGNNSRETKTSDAANKIETDDSCAKMTSASVNESVELHSQTKHDPIQKSTSNLGKLLSLFQHSSCFFSESTPVDQLKGKSTFQGSINSVMTLGDKFHYYIKDKKDRIYNREAEESLASLKNKSSKFFNVSQLPSLQSLANMIPSFKFDSNLSVPEQSDKPYRSNQVNLLLEKESGAKLTEVEKKCTGRSTESNKLNVCIKKGRNASVPTSDDQLSEGIRSKYPAGVTNKDVVLVANCIVSNIIDTCSKIVNDNLLMHVSSSNTIVPVPKLIGIPEYSALKAAPNDIRKGNIAEILEKVDPISIKGTDDKTLTDSINFTSDSNSLSHNVTYNASSDTHTVRTPDKMHNLVILNLSTKGDVSNNSASDVNSRRDDAACSMCNGRCVCNVNNKLLECYGNASRVNKNTNCLNNEVTKMYSIDSDSDKNVFISVRNTPSNEIEKVNVNSSTKWRGTVLSKVPDAKISNINFTWKDADFECPNGCSESCALQSCKSVSVPMKRKLIKLSLTRDNKFFQIHSTFRNMNIAMSVPRIHPCMTNFNTFTLRNLVRHVADICIDGTSIKELSIEINSNDWSSNNVKSRTLFYDLSQICSSSTNATTENSEGDCSGIEENYFPGNCIGRSERFHEGQQLEENDAKGDKAYLNESNASSNSTGLNIAQDLKCADSEDVSDSNKEYLNAIKRAVATSVCSTTAENTGGQTTVDGISEQNSSINDSSTVMQATSTK